MTKKPASRVPLAAAITVLRQELLQAWTEANGSKLRFRVAPVELTLEVAVTQSGTGSAGIKWWLIDANAKVSRERAVKQTIRLTLDPVIFDDEGQPHSFLIDGSDTGPEDDAAVLSGGPSLDGADD